MVGRGYWLLVIGYLLPVIGYQLSVICYQLLGSVVGGSCGVSDASYRPWGIRYQVLVSRCRLYAISYQLPAISCRLSVIRYQLLGLMRYLVWPSTRQRASGTPYSR